MQHVRLFIVMGSEHDVVNDVFKGLDVDEIGIGEN